MRALRPGERTALVVAGSCVFSLAAAIGIGSLDPPARQSTAPVIPPMDATPFVWPGTSRPPTVKAADAGLADDELVIGVLAKGKPRAYRRSALAGMTHHVVNDVVGDTPVTVAHCDRSGCSRVYTSNGTEPLRLMTGGYLNGMLVYLDGVFYELESGRSPDPTAGSIPYLSFGFEEMTWGKWRAAHPDTDVYVGSPTAGQTAPVTKE